MQFNKYQHLERFGTSEVNGIEFGVCHVFPKIDGSNGSIWLGDDGQVKAGSRTRELNVSSDNQGFYGWAIFQANIRQYLDQHPTHRLFGEWMVPHSLKTYRKDVWRHFYVFDVVEEKPDGTFRYIPYDDYSVWLDRFSIRYVTPLAIINNGTKEQFMELVEKNFFLIEDDKGAGEGIVIKRYDFVNRFGRTTWAKIVRNEFKEKNGSEMGVRLITNEYQVEQAIAAKYTTSALVEKEFAKIDAEVGFTSKHIHRLLHTVFYSVVKEDCWEFIKEHKNPQIDFKRLQAFVFAEVKKVKPELF